MMTQEEALKKAQEYEAKRQEIMSLRKKGINPEINGIYYLGKAEAYIEIFGLDKSKVFGKE